MKHDPTIWWQNEWWRIETDKAGKKWAVSFSQRMPFAKLTAKMRVSIDAAHARRGEGDKKRFFS